MYIGSFFEHNSPVKCNYSYKKRGLCISAAPDLYGGDLLIGEPTGWDGTKLLNGGVDIWFEFSKKCFVDHIYFEQGEGSAIGSIEVFTCESGILRAVGRLDAQTGSVIREKSIQVLVGWCCDNVVLRLNADFLHIVINKLDIRGSTIDEPAVFPQPCKAVYTGRIAVNIDEIAGVCANHDEDVSFVAALLCEKLSERYGIKARINPEAGKTIKILKTKDEPEKFTIHTEPGSCVLEGSDRRALIYGAEALLQLVESGAIPTCSIEDSPAKEFRGVHFALPERPQFDFYKRLIKYVLAPMRYNTIFMQISAGMRYDKYPEINEKWLEASEAFKTGTAHKPPHMDMVCNGTFLEKEEVTALVRYAESYGFEIIPEIESLGHAQYITMAFPELAEIEECVDKDKDINLYVEDEQPSSHFYHCCCPSNERYYEILFHIMDEVIDVVKPKRFVHIGHDEVYQIGVCKTCHKKGAAEVFAEEVTRLHDYLAKKGLRTMMWADMLHDVTEYETPAAIKKIPKDIIMLDFIWYFHPDKNIEDHLLSHGFETIVGNLYSSHFPRYEERISKNGMIGGEISTWVKMDEYTYAFEGKMYDFIFTANMLWSLSYRNEMRLSYNNAIIKLISSMRPFVSGKEVRNREKDTLYKPDNKKNLSCDIGQALPPRYDGTLVVSPGESECEISINGIYTQLLFAHAADKTAARIPWTPPNRIGDYEIKYEDGTTTLVPIEYGGNMGYLKTRYGTPLSSPIYRHEGYTATYLSDPVCGKTTNGEDFTIYEYSWENPIPTKKIMSITPKHNKNSDAAILLFLIEGLK